VVATTHPSAILRAGEGRDAAYRALVADLATAAARLVDGAARQAQTG
jgi:hypothetical protein